MAECIFRPIGYPLAIIVPEVLIHDQALEELTEIINGGGAIAGFRSACKKRISFLLDKRRRAVLHNVWFEELRGTEGLFCMRFDRSYNLPNLRIIYCFNGETPYLLVSFIEERKADYQRAIEKAQQRRASI